MKPLSEACHAAKNESQDYQNYLKNLMNDEFLPRYDRGCAFEGYCGAALVRYAIAMAMRDGSITSTQALYAAADAELRSEEGYRAAQILWKSTVEVQKILVTRPVHHILPHARAILKDLLLNDSEETGAQD